MKNIFFYSNKGGVGKTTLALTLFDYLSKEGKKVSLVDLDNQNSSNTILNLNPRMNDYNQKFIKSDDCDIRLYDMGGIFSQEYKNIFASLGENQQTLLIIPFVMGGETELIAFSNNIKILNENLKHSNLSIVFIPNKAKYYHFKGKSHLENLNDFIECAKGLLMKFTISKRIFEKEIYKKLIPFNIPLKGDMKDFCLLIEEWIDTNKLGN